MITSLRGFRDILPPESELFAHIEAAAREVFGLYGYQELRIPTLEQKELFVKSTGDTTDIVEKEMYAFTDGGGRAVAMRPEGTPGVVRAYIQNNLGQTGRNGKYFYMGGMFRAERPQAGRYREFTQIGAEHIGNPTPAADAESISMLVRLLEKAGVGGCSVVINSLGCGECRKAYREILLGFLRGQAEKLCEPCRGRIERNPLRALDCKTDGPWLAQEAPKRCLCPACETHFSATQRMQIGKLDAKASSFQHRIRHSIRDVMIFQIKKNLAAMALDSLDRCRTTGGEQLLADFKHADFIGQCFGPPVNVIQTMHIEGKYNFFTGCI